METFKYLNGLAQDCSRLVQSFSEKVKTSMRGGTQFKPGEKIDPIKEMTKQLAPEVYKKF